MQFALMILMVGGIVALDQWTKLLVVTQIPLYARVDALPGVFHLTYVQNTGAAFSMFEGMQWLFTVVFVLFTLLILWDYFTKKMPFSTFERWMIAAVYGGGLGNMIDRIRLGYVVDMIRVEFIEFPVFNVADCFITCGAIALIASLVLLNKDFWKDDLK